MIEKKRKNEFSWSKTRDETFRICLRRYFYEYYASWGGWEEGATAQTREIYLLKRLKTREMWVGDLVHRAVQRSITNLARGVAVLPVNRIVEITLNLMRNEFRSSKRGSYRHTNSVALFEHEYGIPVPDGEWKASAAVVETCLRNFYGSGIWADLSLLGRDRILEVENLSSFDFEKTRCWVVLDAAWRGQDGLTIADWKTGRGQPGGVELQLTGYALYAGEAWQVDPTGLVLLEYNLFHDRVHRYLSDKATVERTRSYIRGSITDMKSLLVEEGTNTPLPEERFVQVNSRMVCPQCKYQRICRPAILT